MMCQSIGLPPISTIGFGRTAVSSLSREPKPPARITAFTAKEVSYRDTGCDVPRTSPPAASACTRNTGAALGAEIAVSKPCDGAWATCDSVAGVDPASTRQDATPVAPFQL